jgi:hypothetical protein
MPIHTNRLLRVAIAAPVVIGSLWCAARNGQFNEPTDRPTTIDRRALDRRATSKPDLTIGPAGGKF